MNCPIPVVTLESIPKASKVPVVALALPLMLRPLLRHTPRSLALTMPFSLNDVVLVDLAVPSSKADKNALVIIEQVNKFYGDLHVLKDINTTVARGEVVPIWLRKVHALQSHQPA